MSSVGAFCSTCYPTASILGRAPNAPSFLPPPSAPYRSTLFRPPTLRHNSSSASHHRSAASLLTIQYPYRPRHRGGLVQYIFSSPARLPQFLPTTSTCSRATELKMLCISIMFHQFLTGFCKPPQRTTAAEVDPATWGCR